MDRLSRIFHRLSRPEKYPHLAQDGVPIGANRIAHFMTSPPVIAGGISATPFMAAALLSPYPYYAAVPWLGIAFYYWDKDGRFLPDIVLNNKRSVYANFEYEMPFTFVKEEGRNDEEALGEVEYMHGNHKRQLVVQSTINALWVTAACSALIIPNIVNVLVAVALAAFGPIGLFTHARLLGCVLRERMVIHDHWHVRDGHVPPSETEIAPTKDCAYQLA